MMNYKSLTNFVFILFFSFLKTNAQTKILYPKNEFRAVWIATVVNIDWPQSATDSVQKQKKDYIELLDTYKKLNYNAVIVQIRANGDAFYPSELAPWSRYLTGKEGQEPQPYYDPLAWMISEAHLRGFEFHAWLNPFRATFDLKIENLSPKHDFYLYPKWMIQYGGKFYYNPGLPEVQEHLTKVVAEVVENYDVDAIHFDDYFYPYTINGQKFDDTEAFIQFGGNLSLADWRRSNVNRFVELVSTKIKTIKPWVQFGISPFGVWRNKSKDARGSDTQAGQTNYDDLYADPLAWMDNKWIDYILPQLYWSLNHPKASYAKLLQWWSQNSKNTAIYIGNSSYKIKTDADKKWHLPTEIPNQIDFTRSFNNVGGNAFFSAKWFIGKNKEVTDLLIANQYRYPAIPAPVPQSKKDFLIVPKITVIAKVNDNFIVSFASVAHKIRHVVLYATEIEIPIDLNDPSQIIEKTNCNVLENAFQITIPTEKLKNKSHFALTFIDYYGNESQAAFVSFPMLNQAN